MRKGFYSFFAVATLFGFAGTAHADALVWANGDWGLPEGSQYLKYLSCAEAPLSVSINAEETLYSSKQGAENRRDARILDHGENFIKIKYEGETRLMTNGEVQIWTMYFLSENEFVWVREDWIIDEIITDTTGSRIRCKAGVA